MMFRLKDISLGNWIFISMILGLIVGLILNFYVTDSFFKDTILMDNLFNILGNGFIKLIKMIVVPLVFCSIVVAVASISDVKQFGKIGGSAIAIYIVTTILAVTIAIVVSNFLQPGSGLTFTNVEHAANSTFNQTFASTSLDLIPENPIGALNKGNMIQIIVFAIFLGFVLSVLKDQTKLVNEFFVQSNKVMMEMTAIIMKLAPIGVFCLMAKTFGELGLGVIMPVISFIGCVFVCLCIQMFIVYPIIFISLTKLNPIRFYKKFIPVMLFAFYSCSSNATIPINLEKLTELGVSMEVSSFTIPLGATINMDGTSIMQACAVMFTAQACGIDFGISTLITVVFTILLISIGTPGVPHAGVVTLNTIFLSIGLPLNTMPIFYGIDNIVNMLRIVINVVGDGMCTIIVSFRNNFLDVDVYNGKKSLDMEAYKKECGESDLK